MSEVLSAPGPPPPSPSALGGAHLAPAAAPRVPWRWFLRRFLDARFARLGLVLVAAICLAALAAPLIAPHDPVAQNLDHRLEGPSLAYPLGTDDLGRDILSRVLDGARVSLAVGVGAVLLGAMVGSVLGLVAGYFRGWVETLIMRLTDAALAFPSLVLALAIAATLGAGFATVLVAIGVVNVPRFVRLVRGQVLAVSALEYVQAARVIGSPHTRIMFGHILPNVLAPIIVQASLSISLAILTEATLSFLGLGIQPPLPSWGSMMKLGAAYLENNAWMAFGPGAAIFLTMLGFNFLGDALRDTLDPRIKI